MQTHLKHLIIVILLLVLPLNALAQTYIPMLAEGNQWNELAESPSLAPEHQYTKTYISKLGNDTIISGQTYFKFLTAKDKNSSVWERVGFVREDVENQKVYFKQLDKPEVLLYDFDVEIGDVIQLYDVLHSVEAKATIENIESVSIAGATRKRITVRSEYADDDSQYSGKLVWIEGIGCLDGFLRSAMTNMSSGGESLLLLCFSQEDTLIYKSERTDIDDCFVWTFAQTAPFQNAKWTYLFKVYTDSHYLHFEALGDTIIDGISRNKLYLSYVEDSEQKMGLAGFLHTDAKKIYLRASEEEISINGFYGLLLDKDKDFVIFDFALEKGEEFSFSYTYQPYEYEYELEGYVDAIDEIAIGDEMRKRYLIKSSLFQDTWIERIGSAEEGIIPHSIEEWLTCECYKHFISYSENGEILYRTPYYPTASIDDPAQATQLTVYPNPATSELSIQSNSIIQEAAVYNMQGQLLKQVYPNQTEATIEVSALPSGIYTVRVTDESGKQKAALFRKK